MSIEIEIIRRYEEGNKVSEIAADLKLSGGFVMGILKINGVYDKSRDFNKKG